MFKELKILLSNSMDDKEKWKSLLQSDYSDSFNLLKENNIAIFRGDNRQFNINTIESKFRRSVDKDSLNFYTTLLSESLPSWSNYPKRNHSIVCTNSNEDASGYGGGNVYIIFPRNNTKIAVCPTNDIWFSFSENPDIGNLALYEDRIENICVSIYGKRKIFRTNGDIQDFCYILDRAKVDMKLKKSILRDSYEILNEIFKFKYSTLEYFDSIFNPNLNKFKLLDIKDFNFKSEEQEREVWFDNQAIAIKFDLLEYYTGIEFKND